MPLTGVFGNVFADGDHVAEADARLAVVYNNGGFTGQLDVDMEANLPAETDVLEPVTFGTLLQFTGAYFVTFVDDVRLGVVFGKTQSETGLLDLPAEADVRLGVEFDQANQAGLVAVPSPNDVRLAVAIDQAVGTVTLPVENDVRILVTYDANLSRTGTLSTSGDEPIFPPQEDVRFPVEYGTVTEVLVGNYEPALVQDVRLDVTYGARGIEYTGQLVVQEELDETVIRFKLTQTDSYLAVDGRALVFQNVNSLDLTNSDLFLTIVGPRYRPLIQVAVASIDVDGNPAVEITSEEMAVASGTYRFDVRGTLASGSKVTVDRGWLQVALRYTDLDTLPTI